MSETTVQINGTDWYAWEENPGVFLLVRRNPNVNDDPLPQWLLDVAGYPAAIEYTSAAAAIAALTAAQRASKEIVK